MRDEHVLDELSAYIDGEASQPERIARHLQSCQACASHHIQLQKISTHLQMLSPPENQPEFFVSVMAEISRSPEPTKASYTKPITWKPLFAPLALAALLLLCVGLALTIQEPKQVVQITTVVLPVDIDLADEDAIIAKMQRFLEDGLDLSLLEGDYFLEEDLAEDVTIDTVFAILRDDFLRQEGAFDLEQDEAFYTKENVYGLMNTLSNEEVDTLGELLLASGP